MSLLIHADAAYVALLLFTGFFLALIMYLRREDRREGYPLVSHAGRPYPLGSFLFRAAPKTFRLPHGQGTRLSPGKVDDRALNATQSPVPGSPILPKGNPMIDGLGPAAYTKRADTPELTAHGDPRIVPLALHPEITVATGDCDPRGLAVIGADGKVAGTCSDIWADRAEVLIRYLEVKLASGASVLLPMTQAIINKGSKRIVVEAISAAQFADVPQLAARDRITLNEEERVVAYFGGGYLWGLPGRSEPLI